MTVEFNVAQPGSYGEYLTRHDLRDTFELAFVPDIRELIGPVPEIFRNGGEVPPGTVKDYCYNFEGPFAGLEVAAINLRAVSEQLSPLEADIVTAFQAMFVKKDEIDERLTNLRRDIGVAAEIAGKEYSATLACLSHRHFTQALATLPPVCESAKTQISSRDIEYLRGRLLAGLPGHPQSALLVNLDAAETAFIAAANATKERSETVAAWIGAGRAAYARGQRQKAEQHYRAALALQECGEAWFQLARLRLHARDRSRARVFLAMAFVVHWSFALRAACDPMLMRRRFLLKGCIRMATRWTRQQARDALAAARADLEFLEEVQDPAFGLNRFPALTAIRNELDAIGKVPRGRTLKSAFELRKRCARASAAVARLAADYCALLAQAENEIVMRDVELAAPRPPAAIARSIADHLEAILEMPVVLVACLAFAVAWDALDAHLHVAVRISALVAGLGATVMAGLAPLGFARDWLFDKLVPPAAAWQERALERERLRLESRRRQNEIALIDRFAKLAQRFGVTRALPQAVEPIPDAAPAPLEQRLAS